MKKRIICSLFVVFMVLAFTLAGCQVKDEPKTEFPKEETKTEEMIEEGATFTTPGTWPIADEVQTATALIMPHESISDFATNYTTLFMEEATGVHVEFTQAESNEKVMIMFNTGEELPDIYLGGGINFDTQYQLGSQGIFIPLNDWIDNYMPNTKAVMEKHPVYAKTSKRPDGNIYAISSYGDCYHCSVAQKMYLNKAWLDNLGLEVPTTPNEFADVLRVFKAEDANGNGDTSDEIPWTSIANHWHTAIDGFIGNAWIYNDGQDRINVLEDGTLTPVYTKDEFREALSFLAGLYSEGLVDPQMFVQDQDAIMKLTSGEFNRVGAAQLGHSGIFADTQNVTAITDYIALPPLKGPNGNQTAGYYPSTAVDYDLIMVSKYCENPEIPLRWMDYFMTTEATKVIQYGEEGVDWMTPTDGRLGRNGKAAILDTMGKSPIFSEARQNKAWVHSAPYYWPSELFDGVTVLEDVYDHETELVLQSNGYIDFIPDVVLPPLQYDLAVANDVAKQKAQINEFVNTSVAAFVTQIKDVNDDAVWQAYLDTLDELELEAYIQNLQDAYDIIK